MTSLTPLAACLSAAFDGLAPTPSVRLAPDAALGCVLAEDLIMPADIPPQPEALRTGFAVAALDLVGASPGAPVPLLESVQVVAGDPLPAGMDAVLPEDGTERWGQMIEAIRPINPGEGARRAGDDGRERTVIARAGTRLTARHVLASHLAGIPEISIRRPKVKLQIDDSAQRSFVTAWLEELGVVLCLAHADLTICASTTPLPRLACAPCETAWIMGDKSGLVLEVPARFDGMVAACLALGLPALAHLTGAAQSQQSLPLARKLTSHVGLSELVLLQHQNATWVPQPTGHITLAGLASADAFALLAPESEGCAAGAHVTATPLEQPFG